MKKILFVVAAILGLAFVSPDGARAGGPHVSVSFGVPLPVVVVPSRGYYLYSVISSDIFLVGWLGRS